MIQRLYLTLREIFSGIFISLVVFCSVASAVIVAGVFTVLTGSFNSYIDRRFMTSIPPNTIRVTPKPGRSVLLFQVKDPGQRIISERTIARIRSLKGVASVEPVLPLATPLQAQISFMGLGYKTDILAMGIPDSLALKDVTLPMGRQLWKSAEDDPGRPVPVLVPRGILQAYNDGMAGPNNLPRLSEKGAVGIRFRLLVGYSSIRTLEGYLDRNAIVAGFTDSVNAFALLLPLRKTLYYNRKFDEKYRPEYSFAYVKSRDHASQTAITESIRRMGFNVESEKMLSQQILDLRQNVELVLNALRALILALSGAAVVFAALIATMNRLEYYRILRIVGASKLFISFTILVKYALIGAAASYTGMKLVDQATERFAEKFHLGGMVAAAAPPEGWWMLVLAAGVIMTVAATVPALARLWTRALDSE